MREELLRILLTTLGNALRGSVLLRILTGVLEPEPAPLAKPLRLRAAAEASVKLCMASAAEPGEGGREMCGVEGTVPGRLTTPVGEEWRSRVISTRSDDIQLCQRTCGWLKYAMDQTHLQVHHR